MAGPNRWMSVLRRLRGSERGAVLPLVAVSLPVLLGAGALGVDVAHIAVVRGQLQAAADAAARASVSQIANPDAAEDVALDYARANLDPEQHGQILTPDDIEIGSWRSEPGEPPSFTPAAAGEANAVRVTTRRASANNNPLELALAPILGVARSDITATAVAAQLSDGTACVLSLADSGAGIRMNGSIDIDASSCGFAANSTSRNSLEVDGAAANADLQSLYLAGGKDDPHGTISSEQDPIVNAGAPLPDPYARRDFSDLPETVSPTADEGANIGGVGTTTLEPGVYPDGLSISGAGNVQLEAGVYVIEGNISMSGAASLSGEGITLVSRDPDINISGSPDVELTAPDSGPTRGIAMMRRGDEGGGSQITGTSNMTVDGAFYFPDTSLSFKGTPDTRDCLQVVAQRVSFRGNAGADFAQDCDDIGTAEVGFGGARLVR